MFRDMIKMAVDYKQNPSDFMDEVMQELEVHLSVALIKNVLILNPHLMHDLFKLSLMWKRQFVNLSLLSQNFDLEKKEENSEADED